MLELVFDVTGMTCAACSARVEKVTTQIDGVDRAEVNLLSCKMTVQTENKAIAENIISAVQKAGYGARLHGETDVRITNPNNDLHEMNKRIIVSAIYLVILMYFTMGHMIGLPVPAWYHGIENALVAALLQLFLTLPVVYLNRSYFQKGIKSLLHRSPNMDSLIAVGSGASLIYGVVALFRMSYAMGNGQMEIVRSYSENLYFESAAMILTLITLGKFLESRAKGKTGDAIAALMDLSPKTAVVRIDGNEIIVPVEQVKVGDIVKVAVLEVDEKRHRIGLTMKNIPKED